MDIERPRLKEGLKKKQTDLLDQAYLFRQEM